MRTVITGAFIDLYAVAHVSRGIAIIVADGIVRQLKSIDNDVITLIKADKHPVVDQRIGEVTGGIFKYGRIAGAIRHKYDGRTISATTINRQRTHIFLTALKENGIAGLEPINGPWNIIDGSPGIAVCSLV